MNLIIKIFSIAIVLLFGFNPAAFGQTADVNNTSETGVMKYELKVKGAGCKTDLGMIVSNVQKLEGVKSCKVVKHGATSTLEVAYHAREVNFKTIKSTIENTGTCEDPDARRYKVKL